MTCLAEVSRTPALRGHIGSKISRPCTSFHGDDDEETRRALARLRPKMRLNITATAPQHALWMEHVVLLRVEIYYAQAQW